MTSLKRLNKMNQFEASMIFRLLILVIQLKKLTITQNPIKLKRKLLIIIMINKILLKNLGQKIRSENFTSRLAQTKLGSKNDIADFVIN